MEEWYYTKEGQQQGPVNLGTLRDMAEDGRLRPQDMVWNSSMSDWTPASEVGGIFSRNIAGVGSEAQTSDNMEPGANWANDTHLHEIEPGSEPLEIGRVISRTLELTKKNFLNLFLLGLVVLEARVWSRKPQLAQDRLYPPLVRYSLRDLVVLAGPCNPRQG